MAGRSIRHQYRSRGFSGAPVVKDLEFAFGAWLAMMIVFMPLAGECFFGAAVGLPGIVAALVLHLVYDAALGWVYARMIGSRFTAS